MENISKKRGRPTKKPADLMLLSDKLGLFGDIKSYRGKINRQYAWDAFNLLREVDKDRFAWLCGDKDGDHAKWTLLSELGRIENRDSILAVAAALCDAKPSTQQGIVAVRRLRGVKADHPKKTLTDSLTGFIDDYLQRYPDTEWQTVIDALRETITLVELVSTAKE